MLGENHISRSLFCLPEFVPDFHFPGSLLQSLVTWLDSAESSHFSLRCDHDITTQGLLDEFHRLDLHRQICCKCVTGWLLHRVRSETSEYPAPLLEFDSVISQHLGSYIGSSSNIGFYYNWTSTTSLPGSAYSAEILKNENVRCRFKLLPGEAGESFDQFMIGHVVMEAFANDAFAAAIEIFDLLKLQQPIDHQLNIICEVVTHFSRVFAKFFHPTKTTKASHWPRIQKCLKMPEYIGMGGVQNTSIYIVGLILGLANPQHQKNAELEIVGAKHYTHRQRQVVNDFKTKRNVLKNHIETTACPHEVLIYQKIITRMASWRSVHKQRVTSYISSATTVANNPIYVTSVNQSATLLEIQQQLEHRIGETRELKSPSNGCMRNEGI